MGSSVCHCVCLAFIYFRSHIMFKMCKSISSLAFMSLPDCPCLVHPIWTVSWKHGCPCLTLCVCHNQPISGHTPLSECVHVFMFIWLPISVWCLVDSYIERWVPLCGSVFVSHSPLFLFPQLGIEYEHASVHVFMSIWLLVSPQIPMHSYTKSWEPLCGQLFVSQSPHFFSFTLFIMCTCISTCIYVQLTLNVCSTPYT